MKTYKRNNLQMKTHSSFTKHSVYIKRVKKVNLYCAYYLIQSYYISFFLMFLLLIDY